MISKFLIMILSVFLFFPVHAKSAEFRINLSGLAHNLKELNRKVPPSHIIRYVTAATVIAASQADYNTTFQGNNRGLCETTPWLIGPDGCKVNRARFTFAKGAVIMVFGLGEETVHRYAPEDYKIWFDRELILINTAATIWFAKTAYNNSQL